MFVEIIQVSADEGKGYFQLTLCNQPEVSSRDWPVPIRRKRGKRREDRGNGTYPTPCFFFLLASLRAVPTIDLNAWNRPTKRAWLHKMFVTTTGIRTCSRNLSQLHEIT